MFVHSFIHSLTPRTFMEPPPHVSGSNDAMENKAYIALGQQGHLTAVVAPGFGDLCCWESGG